MSATRGDSAPIGANCRQACFAVTQVTSLLNRVDRYLDLITASVEPDPHIEKGNVRRRGLADMTLAKYDQSLLDARVIHLVIASGSPCERHRQGRLARADSFNGATS